MAEDRDVADRLLAVMHPTVALVWLTSENGFLGGRPVDVMRRHGSQAVLGAIDAFEQGVYV